MKAAAAAEPWQIPDRRHNACTDAQEYRRFPGDCRELSALSRDGKKRNGQAAQELQIRMRIPIDSRHPPMWHDAGVILMMGWSTPNLGVTDGCTPVQ